MFAALIRGTDLYRERADASDVALGVGSFIVLYAVFWVGDKLLRFIRPPSTGEIGDVYGLGAQLPLLTIAALLVFVIGPGEELYWRGLVQWAIGGRFGGAVGLIASTLLYTAAHLVTGSVSLILAAFVAGGVWSTMYAARRRLLPVIISHVLFDLFAFVIAPFAGR